MKHLITLLVALFSCTFVFAQNYAGTGTLKYNGVTYPSTQIDYNLPPDEAEKVIKDQMKTMGLTPEKEKGYIVYRNVDVQRLNSNGPVDLIFKVDRKGSKKDPSSVVSLVTAKPGEISTEKVKGAGKEVAEISSSSSAGAFLESFQGEINNQAHVLSVQAKQKEMDDAVKEFDKMKKDQDKMQKRLEKLQSDIQDNQKAQESQNSKIQQLRTELEALKAAR